MKTLRERTKIQQAFLDGDEIEVNYGGCDGFWEPYTDKHPDFDWMHDDFRIKPEPIEFYVFFTDHGERFFVKEGYIATKPGVIKKFIEIIE